MNLDIRCKSHPEENEYNVRSDRAIDIAYSLSEEYDTSVDLFYNYSNTLYMTVGG